MIAEESVLALPEGLIDGTVEGYRYLFNPRGHHGVIVLFGDAREVFECCEKGMSALQMQTALPWAGNNLARIESILDALTRVEFLIPSDRTPSSLGSVSLTKKKQRQMMVWLQMTDTCNLRCPYCYIDKKPRHLDIELGKALIAKITDDCERAGFDEVVFKMAGGEPTLRWAAAINLIDSTAQLSSSTKVRFHIITNATYLPPKLLEYLVAGKLGVSVSLDGVEQWHDKQRFYSNGNGSFADVSRNIDTLTSSGVRPYILSTITRANVRGLTELARYCIERDLNFRFSFYRDAKSSPAALRSDNATLIEELTRCYEWIGQNLPKRSLYECHKLGDVNLKAPRIRNCGMGVSGITVSTEGEVSLCQYEMSHPCGDVLKSNVVQLMTDQTSYPLQENRIDNLPICQTCKWKFTCAGGCPYLTKHHFGTFHHPSPYCQAYSEILPVLLKVHAIQLIRNFQRRERR